VPEVTVPPSSVVVEVLNGMGERHAAADAAAALARVGFRINGTGNAASFAYRENVVEYPPGIQAAAATVSRHVLGATRVVEDASLPPGVVDLILGATYDGIS